MAGRRRLQDETDTVRIDPIACDGIGMCAHLAPGVIAIDSWGYPVLPAKPVGGRDLRAAKAAMAAGPRGALFGQRTLAYETYVLPAPPEHPLEVFEACRGIWPRHAT